MDELDEWLFNGRMAVEWTNEWLDELDEWPSNGRMAVQ